VTSAEASRDEGGESRGGAGDRLAGVRVIVLDVGGVLFGEMIGPKITDLASCHRIEAEPLRTAARELRPLVDLGTLTEEEFWRELLARIGVTASPADLDVEPYLIPVDGAFDSLERIARDYELAILSNDSIDLSRARRALLPESVRKSLCAVVISAEIGVMKPDERIYRILLDRLGVAAASCLFIDDRPENIAAAREVGMQGFVFESWGRVMETIG
jgi:putative hydrolase of the HAD superfamily